MDFRDNLSFFLAGVAVGALAMFVLDPQQGRRRRALARDKAVHYGHEVSDYVSGTSKDLRNRAQGLAAETRGVMRDAVGAEAAGEQPPSAKPL